MSRDFNEPAYKAWRKKVYTRDGFKCKQCGAKKRLEAHHIKRWADYPELRFDVSNGITLCKKCHKELAGNEADHEARLKLLLVDIDPQTYIALLKQIELE